MSVSLLVRPEAEADLAEAYQWYRERAGSIGETFLDEIGRTFAQISENPCAFPIVHKSVRRALTRRFPYAVFFILPNEIVHVLAVFHQARDPKRLQERL